MPGGGTEFGKKLKEIEVHEVGIMKQIFGAVDEFFSQAPTMDDPYQPYRSSDFERLIRLASRAEKSYREQEGRCREVRNLYLSGRINDMGLLEGFAPLQQIGWEKKQLELSRASYEIFRKTLLEQATELQSGPAIELVYLPTQANLDRLALSDVEGPARSYSSLSIRTCRDSEGRPDAQWYETNGQLTGVEKSSALDAMSLHERKTAYETKLGELEALRHDYTFNLARRMLALPDQSRAEFNSEWRDYRGFTYEDEERDLAEQVDDLRKTYETEREAVRANIGHRMPASDASFDTQTSDYIGDDSADICLRKTAASRTSFEHVR